MDGIDLIYCNNIIRVTIMSKQEILELVVVRLKFLLNNIKYNYLVILKTSL